MHEAYAEEYGKADTNPDKGGHGPLPPSEEQDRTNVR